MQQAGESMVQIEHTDYRDTQKRSAHEVVCMWLIRVYNMWLIRVYNMKSSCVDMWLDSFEYIIWNQVVCTSLDKSKVTLVKCHEWSDSLTRDTSLKNEVTHRVTNEVTFDKWNAYCDKLKNLSFFDMVDFGDAAFSVETIMRISTLLLWSVSAYKFEQGSENCEIRSNSIYGVATVSRID